MPLRATIGYSVMRRACPCTVMGTCPLRRDRVPLTVGCRDHRGLLVAETILPPDGPGKPRTRHPRPRSSTERDPSERGGMLWCERGRLYLRKWGPTRESAIGDTRLRRVRPSVAER